jgi:hypothetical protein
MIKVTEPSGRESLINADAVDYIIPEGSNLENCRVYLRSGMSVLLAMTSEDLGREVNFKRIRTLKIMAGEQQ